MEHVNKIVSIGLLAFAIGFNLWLYRLEPTATIDPNDNAFQFALVDRTNKMWDFANKKCSRNVAFGMCHLAFLIDHWVPNWAEGYNLPYYYSHIPQIMIVGSYRFLSFFSQFSMSLFQYYHWIIYLLLSLFPLPMFLALRAIRLPWLAAGLGALLASHISTDGLYGLDPPSFLWRGYGLSSQLFAMIWLPLAIAYSSRYFAHDGKSQARISDFWMAVLFLTLTAMGHLGLGMIALLSLIPLAARPKPPVKQLITLAATVVFFLSYWITPIVLADNYHNVSFWDPPWKFHSFGAKDIMTRLLNGDLFDWGRMPWMTTIVITGLIAALHSPSILYAPFSMLFLFWLLMYFGRTTWGSAIDLIPGMREFHLSRFIVGLHAAGLFLMPIGVELLVSRLMIHVPRGKPFVYLLIGAFAYWTIYPQTISYASHNDRLITQANEHHAKVKSDEEALFAKLRSLPPGRVFAGRGGGWGKDFRIAETPYYMQLSTYGIPTVLWLPETWSPTSDVEQYFSEDQAKDYGLFGIRYVAAPPNQKAQSFWNLIEKRDTWTLYEVPAGSFAPGVRPAIVATDKRSYVNVVRLWIQSDAHTKGLYPQLTFAKDYPRRSGLPNFKMLDEATYIVPDGSTHNLFAEPPWYQNTTNKQILPIIKSETNDSDMIFKTTVDVPERCQECIVVLKQSFHPNWRARIDGKPAETFTVFPFFTATLVPAGTHEVVFSYEPGRLKILLMAAELTAVACLLTFAIRKAHAARSGQPKR